MNSDFFTSDFFLWALVLLPAVGVLLWDWRAVLIALFMTELGVALAVTSLHTVATEWFVVQTLTIGLCCLILALSMTQRNARLPVRNSNWLLRAAALGLVGLMSLLLDFQLPLPVLDSQITELFMRLALVAFVLLSLSDSALFIGVALLLWCLIVQAITAVLLPISGLVALIGILELLLALACSYLLLLETMPERPPTTVRTDIELSPTELASIAPPRPLGMFDTQEMPVTQPFTPSNGRDV